MDLKGHERTKKDLEGLDSTIIVRLVNSSLRKGLLGLNGLGRILELKRFYQKVQSTQHRWLDWPGLLFGGGLVMV